MKLTLLRPHPTIITAMYSKEKETTPAAKKTCDELCPAQLTSEISLHQLLSFDKTRRSVMDRVALRIYDLKGKSLGTIVVWSAS